MAWLAGWGYRVKLTIDKNDISAALAWHPVRVALGVAVGRNGDDVSFVFDELQNNANRKKIAVTKADGDTELYAEIVYWDDATETAILWVSRDGWAISDVADTDFYLYYDSAHADNDAFVGDTNSAPAEAVWDGDFEAVYHMEDGADNQHIYDSTNHNADGTKGAAGEPTEVAGKAGKAQNYDGGDWIAVNGLVAGIQNLAIGTIEVLARMTNDIAGAFFAASDVTDAESSFILYYNSVDNLVTAYCIEAGSLYYNRPFTNATMALATWYHVAMTHNGTTPALRLNKVAKAMLGGGADPTKFLVDVNNIDNVDLGDVLISTGRALPLEGDICEVRISSVVRSTAWIDATYESLWDDLVAFGGEETPVVGWAGGDVSGVAIATIKNINGVALTTIKKVSGV